MSPATEGNRPARLILVGVGGFGAVHAERIALLQAAGVVELVAGVDPIRDTAPPVIAGTPIHLDLPQALAAAGPVDVVIIAAPIPEHIGLAQLALDSGADVYLEKPPVASFDDFSRLLEVERRSGRVVQVGFQSLGSYGLPALRQDDVRARGAGQGHRDRGLVSYGRLLEPLVMVGSPQHRRAARRRRSGDQPAGPRHGHRARRGGLPDGRRRDQGRHRPLPSQCDRLRRHLGGADRDGIGTHGHLRVHVVRRRAARTTGAGRGNARPRRLRLHQGPAVDRGRRRSAYGRCPVGTTCWRTCWPSVAARRSCWCRWPAPVRSCGCWTRSLGPSEPVRVDPHAIIWSGEGADRRAVIVDIEHASGAGDRDRTHLHRARAALDAHRPRDAVAVGGGCDGVEVLSYLDGAGTIATSTPRPYLHPVRTAERRRRLGHPSRRPRLAHRRRHGHPGRQWDEPVGRRHLRRTVAATPWRTTTAGSSAGRWTRVRPAFDSTLDWFGSTAGASWSSSARSSGGRSGADLAALIPHLADQRPPRRARVARQQGAGRRRLRRVLLALPALRRRRGLHRRALAERTPCTDPSTPWVAWSADFGAGPGVSGPATVVLVSRRKRPSTANPGSSGSAGYAGLGSALAWDRPGRPGGRGGPGRRGSRSWSPTGGWMPRRSGGGGRCGRRRARDARREPMAEPTHAVKRRTGAGAPGAARCRCGPADQRHLARLVPGRGPDPRLARGRPRAGRAGRRGRRRGVR